jgi:hypothetical protein
MAGDFIPHADGAFLEWSKTLVTYAAAHLTNFNVQEAALTPIQTLLTAYQTAYTKTEDPNRGKVDVLAKNEARDALKAALRPFIKAYLTYNPAVSDTDKENMGLPLHDNIRTPTPVPSQSLSWNWTALQSGKYRFILRTTEAISGASRRVFTA